MRINTILKLLQTTTVGRLHIIIIGGILTMKNGLKKKAGKVGALMLALSMIVGLMTSIMEAYLQFRQKQNRTLVKIQQLYMALMAVTQLY